MRRLGSRGQGTLAVPILIFLFLWTLGTLGWIEAEPRIDAWEAAYRGLQMFSLNFTEPSGSVPPLLQVARFGQPVFTILAFAAAVSGELRLILRAALTRSAQQVTIIGYGVAGKAIAAQFRASRPRDRIVALDRSVNAGDHRAARRHGVELVECDVLDAEARNSFAIGLARSHELVIACGADQTNLSLLDELKSEFAPPRSPIRLWVHLGSHSLAERLRESYGLTSRTAPIVEFVEVADQAAQAVLLAHPLVLEARAAGLNRVHVVVHGLDDFGWLCVEQVMLNGIFPAPTFTAPKVSVVVADTALADREWNARHPQLRDRLDVAFHERGKGAICWGDPHDPLLSALERDDPPSLHIFAGADPEAALTDALALRDGMRRSDRPVAPIVVRSDRRRLSGRDLTEPSGVLQHRLTIIDSYDTQASAFGVTGRVLEARARAFHDAYARGPASIAFDQLPHSQRLSNRRAAFHLLEKLRLLGFEDAYPVDDRYGLSGADLQWLHGLDERTLAEFDRLEHLRWRADRLIEGWRAGPRDSERRSRDGLVDDPAHYDRLAPEERGKDRTQIQDFVEQASGERAHGPALRIVDRVWEGDPPHWEMSATPRLVWPDAAAPVIEERGNAVTRLRLVVPPLPPSAADADRRAESVRVALAELGQRLLVSAPPRSRIRFERAAIPPWNWLSPSSDGRVDGVTLPRFVVGFTGHRDVARLGDMDVLRAELAKELRRTIPPGTPLVTGLAIGADTMMAELWSALELGPIIGIVPHVDDAGPLTSLAAEDRVAEQLIEVCETVIQPELHAEATELERHAAVADALLERATLLIALSDGHNGGPGGVEDTVRRARERRMLVRYIATGSRDAGTARTARGADAAVTR